MNISDDRIPYIFNRMDQEYDSIHDLWYAWLFSRLHYIIAHDIIRDWNCLVKRKVLDAGCGTGFQSFLYARTGAEVIGIDVSAKLIDVAKNKINIFRLNPEQDLFDPCFEFVRKYNLKINEAINTQFKGIKPTIPSFRHENILELDFESESFDHVNCCGSVLSFVDNHILAIHQISRVLKPGGSFILELEGKFNFDVLWTILDPIIGGKLGYDCSFHEALQLLQSPLKAYTTVEYPFGTISDAVYMPIKLYTRSKLLQDLDEHDLIPTKWQSIHSVTNIIPSTILHTSNPKTSTLKRFQFLANIEERLPFYIPVQYAS